MINKIIKITAGALALVTVSTSFGALPEHQYACHVSTETGKDGIVLIQANDLEQATSTALLSKATISDDRTAKPTEVKECIIRPKGTFSDPVINEFYRNMPM